MESMHSSLDETFSEGALDPTRWMAHHLPHWSNAALSQARYHFDDQGLVLRIDEDQLEWCPDRDPGVRVSAIQSGHFSGPLGSSVGQHRLATPLEVRTELPPRAFLVPRFCRISMTARAEMTRHHLVSLYLIGFEQDNQCDSGEITLMEVFGDKLGCGITTVNVGIKRINDPRLLDEIYPVSRPIKMEDWHEYFMEWRPSGIIFGIDGDVIAETSQSPHYGMQLMLTMYDLSGKHPGAVVQSGSFHIRRISVEASAA